VQPSGEQWEIHHRDQSATVVEVGGGLRTYEAGGIAVLDGYAVDEMFSGGRGQALVPWPNRLDAGRYTFGGRQLQLPINEVDKGNAIHGLVRWAGWRLVDREPNRVRVGHVLHPQPGYPFTLAIEIDYELDDTGLNVIVKATNRGREPLPYGSGHHPYLTVGEETIDTARVQFDAGRVIRVDDRRLPIDVVDVASAGIDLRKPMVLGDVQLDVTYTDLAREDGGRAWFEMRSGQTDRRVRLWMGPSYTHVMLFSGDTLAPGRRRRGLAVEPMTCAPNAFVTGAGVIALEPGASHASYWGISPL